MERLLEGAVMGEGGPGGGEKEIRGGGVAPWGLSVLRPRLPLRSA